MNISDIIPSGHSNGVSREYLQHRTGKTDRKNRDNIQMSEDLILNLQDGNGYFKPTHAETALVRRYYKQERARAMSILKRLSKCKKWLRQHGAYEQIKFDEVM